MFCSAARLLAQLPSPLSAVSAPAEDEGAAWARLNQLGDPQDWFDVL